MTKKIIVLLYIISLTVANIQAEQSDRCIKCGTPDLLLQLQTGVAKTAGRPALGVSLLSSEGHFRVHYDSTGYNKPSMTDNDRNGVPDYIDSTLVYLEYAWNLEINQLGYDLPLPDNGIGGGDEIDVYILNFGPGGYGITYPDQSQNGMASAYIELDNNYAESETQYATHGYAALKVTTAHEFFHAIQFRYMYNFELSWWMEQSAVWMEERAWNDVNDYLAYLHHFFGGEIGDSTFPAYYKVTSLDENYPKNFKYGAAIWAIFLAKRYGDSQIKIIWDTLRDSSYPHIADFDKAIKNNTSEASGLPDALNEFAIWNYFTRERANTVDFYPDSDRFDVAVDSDFFWSYSPASDSIGIKNLTSRYIELLFVGNWNKNDILKINVISPNTQSYRSSVVFFNNPYDYEIQPVTQQNTQLVLSKHWIRAILVTTSAELLSNTHTFTFETGMFPGTGVETAKPYVFDLHGAYPNPFNPSTTIAFSLHHAEQVSIQVFNAQGQKVDDVFTGDMTAGEKHVLWKPSGQAAGVYFIMIHTPSFSKTTKVLLLK